MQNATAVVEEQQIGMLFPKTKKGKLIGLRNKLEISSFNPEKNA